ncbi:MAG: dienelactone hydrolase family protein [Reyranella sp.]|uniref:dienelactone hydrolase family protein n=1 Tax=Reyranella sp. TaxID=1929291 RepID=UPI001AD1F2FC|nr:dienelactone hydrolase family protein [Reyranella sp.]MBN9087645.1 dienelactone hydrolase family protein [Reyranella sp.]
MSLEESPIDYADGDVTCRGLLVRVPTAGPHPGVVLFPDARGLGETAKASARRLAGEGFAVFVADLYGNGAFTPEVPQAIEWMKKLGADADRWHARARSALDVTRRHPSVDGTKLSAIGYCFGGTTALELGRSGAALLAIVTFHGGLATSRPQDAANIKGRVLVCHGAADPLVLPAQVSEFVTQMSAATIDWEIQVYAGVQHSFTNPELTDDSVPGQRYDAAADARSWKAMVDLLREVFDRRPADGSPARG